MSDQAAPDVSTTSASTESSPVLTIPADEASYSEWRLTGKLPEKKSPAEKPSKSEESAPPEPSAEGSEPEEETAPAPEAGEPQQERKQPQKAAASSRLQEILSDLKAAGLSPAALKNFRYQPPQPQVQPPPPEKTAQPPAPQPPAELKEPLLQDYPTIEAWAKATREFNQQIARMEAQEAVRQYTLQQQQAAVNQAAAARLAEAKKLYGEEAESSIVSAAQAVFNDQAVHPAVKGLINDSPALTHVLYIMGSNQAEFGEFLNTAKTNPGEAIRRLVTLENLVMEELRKQQPSNGQAPERDDTTGRFVSNKPPAKKTSEAPPPAREVSGRGSPPPDDVSAAFQRNDFSAFRNAANRRDLAHFKGR